MDEVKQKRDASQEEEEQLLHANHVIVPQGIRKIRDSHRRTRLPELKVPKGRYPLERIDSEIYAFLGSEDNLVAASPCIHPIFVIL